jgi:hypothetical protein
MATNAKPFKTGLLKAISFLQEGWNAFSNGPCSTLKRQYVH